MRVIIAFISLIDLLWLYAVPFLLVAAMIRGGLRGQRDRAIRQRELDSFD